MCNIIFLDIDGVLNSNFRNNAHQKELSEGILIDIDKVILLAGLVKNTNAKIVLHSGWRFWFDGNLKPMRPESARLAEMLQEHGMALFDVTPDLTTAEIRKTRKFSLVKAKEILCWLESHRDTKNWIVLDDLELHNECVSQHQVRTDQTIGLTRQDVIKAEKMLSASS